MTNDYLSRYAKAKNAGGTVVWHLGGKVFETKVEDRACPFCFVPAVTALPPPLLAEQPDDTTHVCLHTIGGCNHGFADHRGDTA